LASSAALRDRLLAVMALPGDALFAAVRTPYR
jgi:hypothetical protein